MVTILHHYTANSHGTGIVVQALEYGHIWYTVSIPRNFPSANFFLRKVCFACLGNTWRQWYPKNTGTFGAKCPHRKSPCYLTASNSRVVSCLKWHAMVLKCHPCDIFFQKRLSFQKCRYLEFRETSPLIVCTRAGGNDFTSLYRKQPRYWYCSSGIGIRAHLIHSIDTKKFSIG